MNASAATAVPVLTYHSLDDSGSVVSTRPAVFRQQMDQLSALGYSAISADELVQCWSGGATLPPKPIVLTFDDAFANIADVALPILLDRKFGATIYVISDRCGKQNDWADQAPGIPRLPLMSWSAVTDAAAAGFEIGSHTATHPDLRTIRAAALPGEVVGSKETIETKLGRAVSTFAYPFGAITDDASALVARHYRAAFGTDLAPARAWHARHRIPRIDMYYYHGPLASKLFGTAAGRPYIAIRSLGRRLRALFTPAPSQTRS